MCVPANVLRDIRRKWNLAISAVAVMNLLEAADTYEKEVGEDETFETSLLGTDLYQIRGILDGTSAEEKAKEAITPSSDIDLLPRPLFCQVVNIVDVTKPKSGESLAHYRPDCIYKVTLTDGKLNFYALLLNSKAAIHEMAPGTKILITESKILHMDSMAILYHKDYMVLGGKVMTLFRSWMIEREVKSQRSNLMNRRVVSDAPKFEPMKLKETLEDQMSSLSITGSPKNTDGQYNKHEPKKNQGKPQGKQNKVNPGQGNYNKGKPQGKQNPGNTSQGTQQPGGKPQGKQNKQEVSKNNKNKKRGQKPQQGGSNQQAPNKQKGSGNQKKPSNEQGSGNNQQVANSKEHVPNGQKQVTKTQEQVKQPVSQETVTKQEKDAPKDKLNRADGQRDLQNDRSNSQAAQKQDQVAAPKAGKGKGNKQGQNPIPWRLRRGGNNRQKGAKPKNKEQ